MSLLINELLTADLRKRCLVLLHLYESRFILAFRLRLNFNVRICDDRISVLIEMFLTRDDQIAHRGRIELAVLFVRDWACL